MRGVYKIVLLFGLVSLLADWTYEGSRSVIGPYLSLLGASAFVVGFVVGLGEFLDTWRTKLRLTGFLPYADIP